MSRAQYTASRRSKCPGCGDWVEEGDLLIGVNDDGDQVVPGERATEWVCEACV